MKRAAWLTWLLVPGTASAHGLWGHIHVTGWAVENMEQGELRQFLLDDPEVFNALLFGAVFTDTGYAIDDPASRAYSEHAHWEPFIEDFVEWIRVNDPPPWDDLESRKRVAFLLGVASHGLQDSIFDSLFLHQVEERDGVGQDVTDPGTDGFLALDGHLRFYPEREIPMETVLALMETLDEEVTEETIDDAVSLVTAVYINEKTGPGIASVLGEDAAEEMPWGRAHYLDAEVPGSLRAEVFPTAAYQQAIWDRLHQELDEDEVVTWAYPERPRRLRSGDPDTTDSWVTVLFGAGMDVDSVELTLVDADGVEVESTLTGTRWGADPTRLMRLEPTATLEPGAWYTAQLAAGATSNADVTASAWSYTFQVACTEADDTACPPVEADEASIDGIVEDTGDTGDTGEPEDAEACGCATPVGGFGWSLLLPLWLRRRQP